MTIQGLTGEMEVMEILRKHEEGSGGTSRRSSLEELKESIMKVIRAHIEQNKLPFPGGGGGDQARLYFNSNFRYVHFRSAGHTFEIWTFLSKIVAILLFQI